MKPFRINRYAARATSFIVSILCACGGAGGGGEGGGGGGPTGPSNPLTGSILVVVLSTGMIDPNGYMVLLDAGSARAIGVNDSLTFTDVAAGEHQIMLSGLSADCAISGVNPRAISVIDDRTTRVEFTVSCVAPTDPVTGSIHIVVLSTGTIDPDGYMVLLDASTARAIGVNDSLTFTDIEAGEHQITLTGLSPDCALSGVNPRTISVIGNRTTRVEFSVSCPLSLTGRIALHSNRHGSFEIYILDTATLVVTRVTTNQFENRHPDWSPDGQRIAFEGRRSDGNVEIMTVRPDGSDLVNISATDGSAEGGPSWSLAGRIAFESNRDDPNPNPADQFVGNAEIYTMAGDGSDVVRLTNRPGGDFHPDLSPDGTRIAFSGAIPGLGTQDIFVMNADGTNLVNLTNAPGSDFRPVWSPDGTRIAFYSDRDGNPEIYVMNADGTGLRRLTNNPGDDFHPSWSPDGSMIAFASNQDGGGDLEIYVMHADGSGAFRLTNNSAVDNSPSWGP